MKIISYLKNLWRHIKMAKLKKYTADFETIVDPNETYVWAWALHEICKSDGEFLYGNDPNTFIEWILDRKSDTRLYFHNLKFDGEFLLYLFRDHKLEHWTRAQQDSGDYQPIGTYTTLITGDSKTWYAIEIKVGERGRKKKPIIVSIYDSMKILPMSVSKVSEAFNLPISKLEIDYKAHRPRGHKLTKDEVAYIKNDVEIMARALNTFFDQGLDKMTIGANALADFKSLMDSKYYDYSFPELAYDYDIRQAYRGGYTYLKPDYAGVEIGEGHVNDVNGLYSWAMYDNLLPYGEGLPFSGEYVQDDLYPLFIVQISCQFKIKPGHLPTIQIKDNPYYNAREWVTESGTDIPVMTLTNVDLQMLLDHYDVYNLEYLRGWKFKGSKNFFKKYIDKWSKIKADAKKAGNMALYMIAKLMLNSLYGKFGTKPWASDAEPVFVDDMLEFDVTETYYRKPLYIPMACFITAYAREKTIRSGQSLYDRYIYSDTDSLHLIGKEPADLDTDPYRLGAWDHELDFDRAKYIGPKTYLQMFGDQKKVTVAGMPKKLHSQVTIDNFNEGSLYYGKLMPKHIKGGIYLEERTHQIKSRH